MKVDACLAKIYHNHLISNVDDLHFIGFDGLEWLLATANRPIGTTVSLVAKEHHSSVSLPC